MMSCSSLAKGQAERYFEHDMEYYTKNMTNYDRWHGTLAATIGLQGECSKEQFDALLADIEKSGRSRIGVDCTFSAPKSVSLAMARDEKTREDMIAAHQQAVAKIIDRIESKLIQSRSHGETVQSRNVIAAEFLHQTARPTKENGFVPDLDLHSHAVFLNNTIVDGKSLSVDYSKIMSKQAIKEYGLLYRTELATELKSRGYELELTDEKQGFFELAGFSRETIRDYSNRRKQIEQIAKEHGIKDMQKANRFSRETKSKATLDFDGICQAVRKDLFDSKKVTIEKGEINHDERAEQQHELDERIAERTAREILTAGNPRLQSREDDFVPARGRADATDLGDERRPQNRAGIERFGLPELPAFSVDANARGSRLLLSSSAVSRLARLQSEQARNAFVRRQAENRRRVESRERRERLTEIGQRAIKKLAAEKFAFTVPEARQRIMAAGVLDHITPEEAKIIMEDAGLIALGQMERDGKKTKDRYLTTQENIDKERAIVDRVGAGRDTIKSRVLTMDESRAALARAEARAKQRGLASASFSITSGSGEQAEALHHVLVSHDRYIAIQGLAGTGKTTLMERMKWVADEQGITLRGVCFTGKAADGLQAESGIESSTIHAFLNQLEKGKFNEPTRGENLAKAAGEVARESGIIPHEWQRKSPPQPERTRSGNLKRAAREVATDFLPGTSQKAARAALRAEDRELYYQQQNDRQRASQGGIKQEWDFSQVRHLPDGQREIWIVDEAGLVDTNLMDQLQKAAEARGAQVVLSGDVDQLPPVGAGSPMRSMIEDGHMATAYLADIRRQKDNAQLLSAVRESVKGDHLRTFEALEKSGDYKEIKSTAKRRNYIEHRMTDGVAVRDYRDNLLLASTNADRKTYNADIREIYVKRGELNRGREYDISVSDGDRQTTEKRCFADGDRIIFTANDKKVGVKNGTLAVIDRIDERGNVLATTDAGQQVSWQMDKYNAVDHAYCVTNYKAQGMSVGRTERDESGLKHFRGMVVCDMSTDGAPQNRNALYVDISRAKTHAVVVTDSKATLERQTKDFARKITSKDFGDRIREMGKRGVQNNDHYHAPDRSGREELEKALAGIARHTPGGFMQARIERAAIARQQEQKQEQVKAREAAATTKEKTIAQPEHDTSRDVWSR